MEVTMSKQTAVELFALDLYEKGLLKGNGDEIQELLEQAKQMEKEQIEDAHEIGYINGGNHKNVTGEQYYNETYGGQDESNH
jgi:hypothetical protein